MLTLFGRQIQRDACADRAFDSTLAFSVVVRTSVCWRGDARRRREFGFRVWLWDALERNISSKPGLCSRKFVHPRVRAGSFLATAF